MSASPDIVSAYSFNTGITIIRKTKRATPPKRKVRKLKRNVRRKQNEAYHQRVFFVDCRAGAFKIFSARLRRGQRADARRSSSLPYHRFYSLIRMASEHRPKAILSLFALGRCATAFRSRYLGNRLIRGHVGFPENRTD